jgi:hypothetical protein
MAPGSTRSQFLLNEELLIDRRFDTRAVAVQCTELERTAVQSGRGVIADCDLVMNVSVIAAVSPPEPGHQDSLTDGVMCRPHRVQSMILRENQ